MDRAVEDIPKVPRLEILENLGKIVLQKIANSGPMSQCPVLKNIS